MNLAAVWELPVIFFCENNGYAEFSPAATQHAASLERRAAGYGVRLRRRRRQRRRDHGIGDGATWSSPRGPVAAPPWWRRPPTGGTVTTKVIRSATDRRTR